jgi:hypothetical protein
VNDAAFWEAVPSNMHVVLLQLYERLAMEPSTLGGGEASKFAYKRASFVVAGSNDRPTAKTTLT